MDENMIRSEDELQRDAPMNAGLGIAAFVAARPYIDKVSEPKPESPVVDPARDAPPERRLAR